MFEGLSVPTVCVGAAPKPENLNIINKLLQKCVVSFTNMLAQNRNF